MTNEEYWRYLYRQILTGHKTGPRGMITHERMTAQLDLTNRPYQFFDRRKLNLDYIRREFQWYLNGGRKDTRIARHAKLWKDCQNKDGTWNSNYGYYLFVKDGFTRALECLVKDKDSRQAYVSILDTEDHLGDKDTPCTISIGWNIRAGKLNQIVTMRSNDLVFGLGNDAPIFSWLHDMAFFWLKSHYKDLKRGAYIHQAHSLHVYERHFDLARDIGHERAVWEPMVIPGMVSPRCVTRLLDGETGGSRFIDWLYDVSL